MRVYWGCDQVIESVGQLGATFVYLHLFDGCLALIITSDLPVYCLLHNAYFIWYIRYLLLQLCLLYVLTVLCVTALLKLLIALVYNISCLTWRCRASDNHSINILTWLFLLLTIAFLPRTSCRFLFRLKAIIGGFCKNLKNSGIPNTSYRVAKTNNMVLGNTFFLQETQWFIMIYNIYMFICNRLMDFMLNTNKYEMTFLGHLYERWYDSI